MFLNVHWYISALEITQPPSLSINHYRIQYINWKGNKSQLCAVKRYRNEIRVLTHTRHVVTNLDS